MKKKLLERLFELLADPDREPDRDFDPLRLLDLLRFLKNINKLSLESFLNICFEIPRSTS